MIPKLSRTIDKENEIYQEERKIINNKRTLRTKKETKT